MPIDLKWVRSDPNQVREWQNLRRPPVSAAYLGEDNRVDAINFNNDKNVDLVDAVLRKDEMSRKYLQDIQEHKKKLKELQMRLRPNSTSCKKNHERNVIEQRGRRIQKEDSNETESPQPSLANRENLIEEKKALELTIRSAEADWRVSLDDTYKTLCKLSSPVAASNPRGYVHYSDAIKIIELPTLLPDSGRPKSALGIDLEQAWRQYTLRQFSSYPWVELPGGVSVEKSLSCSSKPISPSDSPSITPERALELWGSFALRSPSTPKDSSKSPSSKTNNQQVVTLPTWIHLLTEFLPAKSIWGEKELPRYTAIWGRKENHKSVQEHDEGIITGRSSSGGLLHGLPSATGSFSLELVALTAPSVVDAQEIQNDLVEQLFNYYGSLLSVSGDDQNQKKMLKRVVVAAPELHNHEWSRTEIHFQLHSSTLSSSDSIDVVGLENDDTNCSTARTLHTVRLGWISHWGDAAARACDMSFAGGGIVQTGGKKKYKTTNNASTREYVHLVEASVIDDSSSMWNKILCINSNLSTDNTGISRGKEKQVLVSMAPVLAPYLIQPISKFSSFNVGDLVIDEKNKIKKKDTIFGVLGNTNVTSIGHDKQQETVIPFEGRRFEKSATDNDTTIDEPKFPPFAKPLIRSHNELQKRIRLEKLSCPYEFLF